MQTSQVRAAHILQKHSGSRKPFDRVRQKEVTRSKSEAVAIIEEARSKIKSFTDFQKIAISISECGSGPKGGDLGKFGRGMMQKVFEDAAFALDVGQMSGVVDTDSGIHIIWRIE